MVTIVDTNVLTVASVWSSAWPILVAILLFVIMILVHEFGHFIFAKLMGVKVNEFAVGFGPTLFKWQGKETKYAVRLLPIGGFCAMEGEDEDSDNPRAFCNKKPWKRFLITIAGASFNILFGLLIMMLILAPQKEFRSTVVDVFRDGAVSSQTGLQAGDKIIKVDGRRIFTTYDLGYAFSGVDDGKLDLTVKRNGQTVELPEVTFQTEQVEGINVVTVDFYVEPIAKTPLSFLFETVKSTVSYARIVWLSLIDLITGKYGISQMAGPVGATVAIGNAVKAGLGPMLNIICLITINLGIFNLLPVPALDGGRVFFILVEMIRRKPVPAKYEGLVHGVGLIILLGFILLITAKDILKLITG